MRRRLKRRILGPAVIERTRKRQASRIVNLREGDANTKFFHLKANARKRKNHIQRLQKDGGWAATHEEKATLIQEHFEAAMSPPPPQQRDFNWGNINLQLFNLDHLVEPFAEKEIYEAILQTSPDKAPGPDGFTEAFFRSCWAIIKGDLMATMNSFHAARCINLELLNSANIILIPKKDGAEHISNYRPISLIHSVAKLIAKILALRLAPAMKEIISNSQSAFIRGRSIHDNFQYVRSVARRVHRNRTPMLLIKL